MPLTATEVSAEKRLRPDPQVLRQHVKQVGNELYGLSRQGPGQQIAHPLLASVEELRLVWAALRRMALVPDTGGAKARLHQERELSKTVQALKTTVSTLARSNERAAALIDEQCQALEELEALDEGGEVVTRLRCVAGGFRRAAGEMKAGIEGSSAQLAASEWIVNAIGQELEAAHQETMEDQLTHLLSRVAFEERLEHLASEAAEGGARWCVAIADIERFAAVVETHGDLVADALIYRVAELIQRACEPFPETVIARYDDEQFGVLLPNCPLRHAYRLANEIRDAVAATKWECRVASPPVIITTSIRVGLTEHRDGETVEALLERAEACLEQARQTRRDTVVVEG